MVRDVKRQVQAKWQVDVDCARKKRQHAERESHNKTEQIEIRPGHKTPRNAAPRCADWNSRRRPFGSVIQRNGLRLPTPLMLTRMQTSPEPIRQTGRAKNLRQEQKRPARIFVFRNHQKTAAKLRI